MPKIKEKQPCDYCNRRYWPSRSDSRWCSELCRSKHRAESGKFKNPGKLPVSGVPGITFSRFTSKWQIKIRIEGTWKYIGVANNLEEAIAYREEILNG